MTEPSPTATGGTSFAQQPQVAIQDAAGNRIIGNVSGVTLSLTTPAGASLGCTPNNGPKAAVAGIATFAGSVGLFFTLALLALRYLPIVSVVEVRRLSLLRPETGGVAAREARHG